MEFRVAEWSTGHVAAAFVRMAMSLGVRGARLGYRGTVPGDGRFVPAATGRWRMSRSTGERTLGQWL